MRECDTSYFVNTGRRDAESDPVWLASCSNAKADMAMIVSGLSLALAFIAILLMVTRRRLPGDKD